MKDEYVIINKTAIQKRIEELEKVEKELINLNMSHSTTRGKIDELISVVHQSTPLIPEIEKAMNAARDIKDDSADYTFTVEDISGCTEVCTYGWKFKTTNEDYITNLKLDI